MAKHITDRPHLIAKRARSPKDRLSHFIRPKVSLWRGKRILGTHPCGKCSVCPLLSSTQEFVNPPDNKQIVLREFMNCPTRHVTYGIICSCPKGVGWTKVLRAPEENSATSLHHIISDKGPREKQKAHSSGTAFPTGT